MMGFAEPVIGPAASGRTRRLYPSFCNGPWLVNPYCVIRSPVLASVRGRREAATWWGLKRTGRPIYERVVAVPTGWAAVWP